jgi:GcrA cell cycle regulator
MQSTWEEAHSVALRDCLEKGMSFAEIARALNERFGTAYTRNAAIGRGRRLGLSVPMRERAARALNKPKKADARRIRELRARKVAKAVPKLTMFERAATLQLRCVAIKPRHLALVDLEAATAATLTAAMRKTSPSPFAAIRARKARAIALRIFI